MLLSLSLGSLAIMEIMQSFKLRLDLSLHFVILIGTVKDVPGTEGLWLLEYRDDFLLFHWLWSDVDGFWFNFRKSFCSVINLGLFLCSFGLLLVIDFHNHNLLRNFLVFVLLGLLNSLDDFWSPVGMLLSLNFQFLMVLDNAWFLFLDSV